MRYVLNKATGVYHDRHALTERCNTDQIDFMGESESPFSTYSRAGHTRTARQCSHCRRQGEKEKVVAV
jgi:hypothetical protein